MQPDINYAEVRQMADERKKQRDEESDTKPAGGQTAETEDGGTQEPAPVDPGTIHPDRTGNPPPPPTPGGD